MAQEANGGHTPQQRQERAIELFGGGSRMTGTVIYNGMEIRVGLAPGTGRLVPKRPIPGVTTLCPFAVTAVTG